MGDLRQKGLTALVWDFLGRVLTQASAFIVTIVLARILSPSDFGAIALVMVVVGITQVLADVGLASALVQRKKLLEIHYSSVFFLNLYIAFILTSIFFFSANAVSQFFQIEKLAPLLQVVSFLFILNGLSGVQYTKLRRELNYRLLSKIEFSASFISGTLGIGCAVFGVGVWSLVVQILSQSALKTALLWYFSGWRPRLGFSFKALSQLWSFGFRMFLVAMLNSITERIDYLIIGKLFNSAELGFFQRAKSINLLVVQYSSASLMSVLFPVISQIQNDTARLKNLVIKVTNLLSLLVFLLVGGLYINAEPLLIFLYGPKWAPSVPLLEVLILSAFSYPINALLVNILSGRGNSRAFLRMSVIKKSVFFMNVSIGFYWGVMGYLYGLVVVAIINTSISIYFASCEIKLCQSRFYKPLFLQAMITILSVLSVLWVQMRLDLSSELIFFISNIIFVLLFFMLNAALKTKAVKIFWFELSGIIERLRGEKIKV